MRYLYLRRGYNSQEKTKSIIPQTTIASNKGMIVNMSRPLLCMRISLPWASGDHLLERRFQPWMPS
jgi:hypothetical protein